MRVLCVQGSKFLIKGHWYNVVAVSGSFYFLESTTEKEWNNCYFHSMNFKTIKEIRIEKLKNLGI